MRSVSVGVLSTLLLVLSAVDGNCQWANETVSGRVLSDGMPLFNARVQLRNYARLVQEDYTVDGRFNFRQVAPGAYSIVIQAPGYESAETTIQVPPDVDVLVNVRKTKAMSKATATSVFELQVPSSARQKFQIALKKAEANDCVAAVEPLKKAIRAFSKYVAAYDLLGDCYTELHELSLAEKSFKDAMSVDASGGAAYYGLARIRFEQDQFAESENLALEAHNRSYRSPSVHLLLAKLYLRQGKQNQLRAELQHYVREAEPSPVRDKIQQILK